MGSTSREPFAMESGKQQQADGKKGVFLSRGALWGLAAIFIFSLIVAILVTRHVSTKDESLTKRQGTEQESEEISVKKVYPNVRLPRHLEPINYRLELMPFPFEGNFTIKGRVQVDLKCVLGASNITLHALDLDIDDSSIRVSEANSQEDLLISRTSNDSVRQFFIIHLKQELQAGKNYTVRLEYVAQLADSLSGFYRGKYSENNETRYYGATQFQATDARRAFPCLDEPGLKATFDVSIARKEDMTTLTNMDKNRTQPISGMPGWVWDHYNPSVPMSTYLVAFVVSNLAYMESDSALSKTKFQIWTRPEALDQAAYAADIGPKMLEFFVDYYQVDFPLPKQDMVAIPDFGAGAMENWGLIIYRETALLFHPKLASASSKKRVAIVIAHELAHQWFGNLVTPAWWSDLWLNEGFASYMEYLAVNYTHPNWQVFDSFVLDDLQRSMKQDSLKTSHSISIPVNHPDEISEIFDGITYSKGASTIRMMDNFLTTDTFRKGVSRYLKHFQYSIAEQDDLWRFLTEAAREDKTLDEDLTVKEIMDSWTLKMGYPVVTVSRDEETGETTLTQERFLLSEDNETEADGIDYKWHIPVSYVVQSNADFSATQPRLWIRQNERSKNIGVISEKSEWVILNVQQTGYYRVNYDSRTWELLEKQLLEDHTKIHRVNRAQILDDAFNLAKAGILNYSVPLGLIRYLSKEKSNSPWVAAIRNLGYIDTMLRKTPAYEHYRRFIRSLVDPHMSEVRFERIEQVTGEYDDISKVSWNLNLLSLACQMGHEQCLKSASREFEFFMAKYNESEPDEPLLSPNTKSIVFCNGIKKGGETAFNFAYAHMLRTNIPQERSMLLSKLACTEESWLLSKYLGMLFDNTSGIRLQDFSHVFSAVAYNDVGIYLAFDMLVNKFDEIKQRIQTSLFSMDSLFNPVGHELSSVAHLQQLEHFGQKNAGNLGAATNSYLKAVDRLKVNIKWMSQNYDTLVRYFK